MATYRLCGDPSVYASEPGEEASREGWITHHAVYGPRETPSYGDRVKVHGRSYLVRHFTEVALADAPESCRRGRTPNQGVFDLRLEPAS